MSEPMIYHQAIKLPYHYTAGDNNTRFLHGLSEQRILGGRCDGCATTTAPLRPFCPSCGGRLTEAVDVGPGGIVTTYTTDGQGRTFARIRLDGADTDMLHRVDGNPAIGSRVEPRWSPEPELEITAIESFVVVDPGS